MSAADFKINDASLSSHCLIYEVIAELILARGTLPVTQIGHYLWSRDVARWFRYGLSVAGPFVSRCLTSLTMLPFPHPAHRTGWADFPLPALGERFTRSPTGDGAAAC